MLNTIKILKFVDFSYSYLQIKLKRRDVFETHSSIA